MAKPDSIIPDVEVMDITATVPAKPQPGSHCPCCGQWIPHPKKPPKPPRLWQELPRAQRVSTAREMVAEFMRSDSDELVEVPDASGVSHPITRQLVAEVLGFCPERVRLAVELAIHERLAEPIVGELLGVSLKTVSNDLKRFYDEVFDLADVTL